MSNDRQLNYVNNLQNRDQNLYYVDDASELNSINLRENDKIYAINDNKLFQMEIVDQEDEFSGSIVSFNGRNNTKIKSLVANVESMQDLHGYDHPWPAGSGVNKMPAAPASSNTVNGITYTSDGNGRYTIKGTASEQVKVDFNFNEVGRLIADYKLSLFNTMASINLWFMLNGSYQTYWHLNPGNRTATIAAADAKEFDSIRVIVESGVSIDLSFSPMIYEGDMQTIFTPYSNICLINGQTEMEIGQTGINIWDEQWESGDYTEDGVPHVQATRIRTKEPISCKPSTSYYYVSNEIRAQFFYYDLNDNFISTTRWLDSGVITTPSNCHFIRFYLVATTEYTKGVSINYPATDTSYHSYTGNQISVTFPISAGDSGTVYGSILTINPDRTGMLVVTEFGYTFDGTENMISPLRNDLAMIRFPNESFASWTYDSTKRMSSHFRNVNMISWNDVVNGYWLAAGGNFFGFGGYTIAEFKEYAAEQFANGTPITCYTTLENPVLIPLTASEISGILTTLYGTNNIWSNIGDITVKIAEKGITAFELEPHI